MKRRGLPDLGDDDDDDGLELIGQGALLLNIEDR